MNTQTRPKLTATVWGRPPGLPVTEPPAPFPCGSRSSGPEARLTGRPEVCTTLRRVHLQLTVLLGALALGATRPGVAAEWRKKGQTMIP